LKLTKEQFEDIITIGEAKAAAENKKLILQLIIENPTVEVDEVAKQSFRNIAYILEFRPKPEEVSRGISMITYDESTIFDYYEVKEGDAEWQSAEKGLAVGFAEFINERKSTENDYILRFGEQKYASWEPFAKAFGITELVTFATKIPRALAVKLTRICEEEGETPSWRIRLLVQEYLTVKIKDRVRQVLFEE
jgi:hypothetical protein